MQLSRSGGQASGKKNCLTLLKDKGADIPQSSIHLFAAKEVQFGELSAKLKVGNIPEEDLSLSPLRVESRFFDESLLTRLDLFGSNYLLIDAGSSTRLCSSIELLSAPTSEDHVVGPTLGDPTASVFSENSRRGSD
ncbi:hypothetical protein Bca4012_083726 [Brassica carinata]